MKILNSVKLILIFPFFSLLLYYKNHVRIYFFSNQIINPKIILYVTNTYDRGR